MDKFSFTVSATIAMVAGGIFLGTSIFDWLGIEPVTESTLLSKMVHVLLYILLGSVIGYFTFKKNYIIAFMLTVAGGLLSSQISIFILEFKLATEVSTLETFIFVIYWPLLGAIITATVLTINKERYPATKEATT